jgi:hypothetical protein
MNQLMVKIITRDESLKRIPPFLTQRSGELLPSLGVRRPSVRPSVRRKRFQKSSPLKLLDELKPNLV